MKINKFFLGFALAASFFACKNDTATTTDAANTTSTTTQTGTTSTDPNAAANASATPTEQVPTGPTTTIEFKEIEYNYGKVKEGEVVKHTYMFKNTGKENLIITNAKGSCGCTVPEWPKQPIPPGESGKIDVAFDSKGKPGMQEKRVTVTANTEPAQSMLTIKGEVIPDPNKKVEPSVPTTKGH
ncbi:MAG: DUF1573 domain-containing protein [Saprospiraceae bacterium]|nr:DUF1573 domain-containing protein [Saprospiraceae bacterium]